MAINLWYPHGAGRGEEACKGVGEKEKIQPPLGRKSGLQRREGVLRAPPEGGGGGPLESRYIGGPWNLVHELGLVVLGLPS